MVVAIIPWSSTGLLPWFVVAAIVIARVVSAARLHNDWLPVPSPVGWEEVSIAISAISDAVAISVVVSGSAAIVVFIGIGWAVAKAVVSRIAVGLLSVAVVEATGILQPELKFSLCYLPSFCN